MSVEIEAGKSWMCRLGHHHYVVKSDDNPENPNASHLECALCSKNKDMTTPEKYTPLNGEYMGGGGIGSGH